MKITLIVTTYNWPESLLLVLESVSNQAILPDELIIADDGSDVKTKKLIDEFIKHSNLNIIHSWQEDKGFRAAKSRNKAIIKSSCDYIVLIDGDSVLHRNFIKDHIESAEAGFFVQGSRALLSKKHTNKALSEFKINFSFFTPQLSNKKNSIYSKLLSFIFSNKKTHLNSIKSCNMGFYKKDCLKVNGFNNEFEGWGREDSEFIVRLINYGIKRKNVRFRAIQFHLWHKESSRKSLDKNDAILNNAIKGKTYWCEDGINSLKNNDS